MGLFNIKITYFDTKGKFYTSTIYEYKQKNFATLYPNSPRIQQARCRMNILVSHIRGLVNNGGQGALPGLEDDHKAYLEEGWLGYILLEDMTFEGDKTHLNGLPKLIITVK